MCVLTAGGLQDPVHGVPVRMDVQLRVDVPGGLPPLQTDRARVQSAQVLGRLLCRRMG